MKRPTANGLAFVVLVLALGVVRSFGNVEAQLSWTVLTPRPEPHVSWTRPGVTAAVSVYF